MERQTGRECIRCLRLEERIAALRSELMVAKIALIDEQARRNLKMAGTAPKKSSMKKRRTAVASA